MATQCNCKSQQRFSCTAYRCMTCKNLEKCKKGQELTSKFKGSCQLDYSKISEVADLKKTSSWTAAENGYVQWSSTISKDDKWARYILKINGIIVYQTTQAGLLSSGTYIHTPVAVPVSKGDVVTAEIGFADSSAKIDNNVLNFIPYK